MNLEQLIARRAEVTTRQDEIAALSDPSAADMDEFDTLESERVELDAKIAEAQAAATQQRAAAMRQAAANRPNVVRVPRQASALGSGDDPGFSSIRVKKPEPFKNLGEQLQAVAHAAMNPGHEDTRLVWDTFTPQAAISGAGASVPSDGGYLIQKDLMTEFMNKAYGDDAILSRVRRIPISANSDGLKINLVDETSRATGSRWGGIQVFWGAEGDSATAKKPKFRQASWELKDVIGLMYATNRLLQDASALEAVFEQAFRDEMAFFEADGVINGTGSGQMQGILNATALVSVSKEATQAAASIIYENINKMWSRMWARSRGNSVWLINQDCEPQLHQMSIPVGTGGLPVYLPPGGLSQSPYASLMGRPVIPTEFNATVGTVGDIMLVDLSQYLMIEKGGVQADSSMHVKFTTNEMTFRFIHRVDGQPLWNSALTPFKGSNTLSPFVALATRA